MIPTDRPPSTPAKADATSTPITTIRQADKSNIPKILIMSSYAHGNEPSSTKEQQSARPIGLTVELDAVPFGVALVDTGATRSIMRLTAYNNLLNKPPLKSVRSMNIQSVTGHLLPIVGAFSTTLSSNNTHMGQALIYVVDNTHSDIICDLVIGRSTMACGRYPCVDVTGEGALYNNSNTERVECVPCAFMQDPQGVMHLVTGTESATTQHHSAAANIPTNITTTPPLSNRRRKGERGKREQAEIRDQLAAKLLRVKNLVVDKHYLTSLQQEQLLAHLVAAASDYTLRTPEEAEQERAKLRTAELMEATADQVEFVRYLHRVETAAPGTDDMQAASAEYAAAAVYVPPAVKQPQSSNRNKTDVRVEQAEADEEREIMKNVDSIDFPFTAPPTVKDSPEYRAEKQAAISKMVGELHHLTAQQQNKLLKLLTSYADRFSLKGENMGHTDAVQHEIETTAPPFRERVRPYSPAVQDIIDAEVRKMLEQGLLVPSRSPYASNLLLVRKPDPSSEGGVKNRVCASFVRLNKQTVKDSYPLARISYIFDRIGHSTWFTTMDLLSGFWQVMIKPEHRHKTAVITMRGLYEHTVMPFGLCNAPATFQRLMDNIILPEYRGFIETYIDDLMTHSATFDDHLKHLGLLLSTLRQHKLMVKLSKCMFAQLSVKFLGHIISHGKLSTNPQAIEAVKKWARPAGTGKQAVKAVQSFLGMMVWYSKFIPHYADIARPLYALTHKDAVFEWTDECQRAFMTLRDALTTSPVLAIADPNKPYVLHTDASDVAMGAVLMQRDDDDDLHPIAFASKTFNSAERNYDTTEREALAIVWALEHFNTYCEGHEYTVITDHEALKYIRSNKNSVSQASFKRIGRWQNRLQPYNLEIQYKPGKDNHAADLLSRDGKLMETVASVSHAYPVVTRTAVRTKSTTTAAEKPRHVTFASQPVTRVQEIPAEGKGRPVDTVSHTSRRLATGSPPARTPRRHRRGTYEDEFEVERIINKRRVPGRDNEYEYEVKWTGYSDSDTTWEPLSHLAHAKDKVLAYEHEQERLAQHRQQPQRAGSSLPATTKNSNTCRHGDRADEEEHDDEKQPAAEAAKLKCDSCDEEFYHLSQRLIHDYHVHGTPVPSIAIDSELTTDPALYAIMQDHDSELSYIKRVTQNHAKAASLTAKQHRVMSGYVFVVTSDGLLYCADLPTARTRLRIKTRLRLCVPTVEREKVMRVVHSSALSAHPGITTMYNKMCETMWWPSMLRDITVFVAKCDICQRSKGERKSVLPRPMSIPYGPWTHVAIDHVGPLRKTARGNVYVLVMMCRFTKCVELAAVADTDTSTTVDALVTQVICRHGLMHVLLSDRGSGFVSYLAQQVYKRLGIKHTTTTAYHPQSNGGVEVFNKVLKKLTKVWGDENQQDWDLLLPFIAFAYHTSYHTGIQEQPFFVERGRYARLLPSDEFAAEAHKDVHAYADGVADTITQQQDLVRALLLRVNEEREAEMQEKGIPAYAVGDKVLLYDPATPKYHSKKLVKRWTGPYTILSNNNVVNYTIDKDGDAKLVHVHRLRKYEDADKVNQRERELTLASAEQESINERIAELVQRRQHLQSVEQQQEAQRVIAEEEEEEQQQQQTVERVNLSHCAAILTDETSSCGRSVLLAAASLPWLTTTQQPTTTSTSSTHTDPL